MATNEKTIQDGLISLLTTNEASLRVDARTVTIAREWVEPLSQRDMPLVVVNRPQLEESRTWSPTQHRNVYILEIECIEPAKGQPEQRRDSMERVQLLRDNVLSVLRGAPHLNLAALRVFESHCRYEPVAMETVAGNFHRVALEVTIPTITAF